MIIRPPPSNEPGARLNGLFCQPGLVYLPPGPIKKKKKALEPSDPKVRAP